MCSFVVCVVSLVIRILSVSHVLFSYMNSNLNMLKYERFKEKANQIYF